MGRAAACTGMQEALRHTSYFKKKRYMQQWYTIIYDIYNRCEGASSLRNVQSFE